MNLRELARYPASQFVLLLSVPLALVVFGVIGLVKRPPLEPVVSLQSGTVEGTFTFITHTVTGPTRFKNFLVVVERAGEMAHLGMEQMEYEFPVSAERFRSSRMGEDAARRFGITLDHGTKSLALRYRYDSKELKTNESVDDVLAYALSLKPVVSYKRSKTAGSIRLPKKTGKGLDILQLAAGDEVLLLGLPTISRSGEASIISEPEVSYSLAAPDKASFTFMAAVDDVVVRDASGTVAVGKSRWTVDPGDRLNVSFVSDAVKKSSIDLGGKSGPGTLLKLPDRVLNLECTREACRLKLTGRAHDIQLNREPLRETLFGLGANWFIGALAGGLLGGVLSMYFGFVKRSLRSGGTARHKRSTS